jgi:hypothetical protein
VPLGADREAVEAAVGRRPDGEIGKAGRTAEVTRRVLIWEHLHDELIGQLLVELDEDGRAVSAEVVYWHAPTLWNWFRAWLGW